MAIQMQALANAPSNGLLAPKPSFGVAEPAWTRVSLGAIECEVAIMYVTPSMAKEFFDNRRKNRNLKPNHADFLSRQLNRGLWAFTGQPLIFNRNGELMDGQHRCRSGFSTGKAFVTLAVRGISDEAFDRLDCGSRRTKADVLTISEVKNHTILAAMLPFLLQARATGSWWVSDSLASGCEILSELEAFPGAEKAALIGRNIAKIIGQRPTLWGTAYYLAAKVDLDTATEFFGSLISGLGPRAGDPATLLRNKMLEFQRAKINPNNKQFAGLVARAWNARRQNRTLAYLRPLGADDDVPPFA